MRLRTLRGTSLFVISALAAVAGLAAATVSAQSQEDVTYTVTVENLTDGQPLTPPIVAAHTSAADVFEVGQAASPEVQQVAENGNLDPLVMALGASDDVLDVVTGDAPVMPGQSASVTIAAPAGSSLSVIAMLICTNDGFTGVDSIALPSSGSQTVDTDAYDAGTEQNTEDFADLVPPCQELVGVTSDDAGTGESNPALAEGGVIAAHAGIQGGTDLTLADHAWTDPVAQITVSVEAAGLPDSGGEPPAAGSGALWLALLAAGGASLIAGGAALVAARRAR